jgi:hypothetical protein
MARITGRLVTIAVLGSLAAGAAAGQSFSGNYQLFSGCDPTVTGTLSGGPAQEEQFVASNCTFLCGVPPFSGLGSVNESRWSRCADKGVLASVARVFGQQTSAAPCGSSAGGATLLTQMLDASDVVFTDTANPGSNATIFPITMNMDFRARAIPGPSCTSLHAELTICGGLLNCGNMFATFDGVTNVGTGVLTGYPNDGSLVTLTTGVFQVTLGASQVVHMQLFTHSQASLCESFNPTTTVVVTEALLSLPRIGPVFNLPPGITCNSVELGIVNNQWVSPAAASVTSVGSGCLGSNGQPVVASPGGLPQVGNLSFAVTLTGPPEGTPAFLFLALDLAASPQPVGGNCFVLLDVPSALSLMAAGLSPIGPVPITGGAATFPTPVPMVPALFGFEATLQGVALDVAAPAGLTLSNALSIVAGT